MASATLTALAESRNSHNFWTRELGPNTIEHIGTDNTNPTYYTHDQHGDTRVLTDQTGAVTATYKHTPFGVSTREAGGTASTPLLYGTGHTDTETGLIYLIHRYFDPNTGNFTRTDPFLALTGHPYSYVDNNPLNSLDPTGLCTASDAVGGALDFFGVERDNFCDWGASGAAAVNQLAGGIVNGVAPESVSDAYNQHVGIDESSNWYSAVEQTSFWGSMLYGGYGLARGGVFLGAKFCPSAFKSAVSGWRSGRELSIGNNFRIALGNKNATNTVAKRPHYHRRVTDGNGNTIDGQGIGRHRPWERKSTDTRFWDRF